MNEFNEHSDDYDILLNKHTKSENDYQSIQILEVINNRNANNSESNYQILSSVVETQNNKSPLELDDLRQNQSKNELIVLRGEGIQEELVEEEEEENDPALAAAFYRDLEEDLRKKYYKSNPLRNFASSKSGHSILPNVDLNKKKLLPKIFSELRITDDIQEDRNMHKKKLRTILKINFNSLEQQKNPIDSFESAKKIYSEYCKYNLTKPINTSNVESILKNNLTSKQARRKRLNMNNFLIESEDSSEESDTFRSYFAKQMSEQSGLSGSGGLFLKQKQQKNKQLFNELLIDAQTVKIKDLNEIGNEIKHRKRLLAKSNLTDNNKYAKYQYRVLKSALSRELSQPEQHKGSIYNYRQAVKAANEKKRDKIKKISPDHSDEDELDNGDDEDIENEEINILKEEARLKFKSNILKKQRQSLDTDFMLQNNQLSINNLNSDSIMNPFNNVLVNSNLKDNTDSNCLILTKNPNLFFTETTTQDDRYKLRIKQARKKILNEAIEKTNLNKMTILQPFEETKILINIDSVPSKLLNNLLNKQTRAPRYYMPPIRAFGYFRKVVTNEPTGGSNTQPANRTPSNHNNFENQSKTPAKKLNNSAKMESLKSLSEKKTEFFIEKKNINNTTNVNNATSTSPSAKNSTQGFDDKSGGLAII